jgi:hypothetical protein
MWRQLPTRAALTLWAIVTCQLGMADDVDAPADAQHAIAQVKLDEAIELLRAWHASFETLRFEYRWRNSGQLRKRFPEWADTPEKLDGWYHITKAWLTKGALARTEELTFEYGQLARRAVTASNGRFTWTAEYVGKSEIPRTLTTTASRDLAPPPGNLIPGWLGRGFYFSPYRSQGDYLRSWDARANDIGQILGSLCVEFSIGNSSITENAPAIEKWLDLEHDGLERLITIDYTRHSDRWECLKFRRLSNGHWFPKQVEVTSDTSTPDEVYEVEVTVAEVNEVFDSQLFEPPPWDDRTQIHDSNMFLGPKAHHRTHGGMQPSLPLATRIWHSSRRVAAKNLWLIPPVVFAIAWGIHAWWRRGRVGASGDKQ